MQGLKPPAYQAPFSYGSGGVNSYKPHQDERLQRLGVARRGLDAHGFAAQDVAVHKLTQFEKANFGNQVFYTSWAQGLGSPDQALLKPSYG